MDRIVVAAFAALALMLLGSGRGDDLSATYIGCRLLAGGQGASLFSHDPVDFSAVYDPAWTAAGRAAGFHGTLHPYVQAPLWVVLLRPACLSMGFAPFRDGFVLLCLLALGGTVLLVARHWTRHLHDAGLIALLLAALALTQPFRYAIFLAQNHALFLFLTVLALVWAERGRPVAAGIALACAALVKITPGFMLLYWLVIGQRRAALAFVGAMAALAVLTLASVGPGLSLAYAHELARISNVLLLAFNNQSLAAWWGGRQAPPAALHSWSMLPMPPALKFLSLALTLAATVAGGLVDRHRRPDAPPLGAAFALLAATVFASIAWSHYFIVLIIPVMLLLDGAIRRHAAWPLLLAALLFVLNANPLGGGRGVGLLVRGEFLSGVLALAGLAGLAATGWYSLRPRPDSPR